jgi:eukaryotic-like serine/threonine-protein kinase
LNRWKPILEEARSLGYRPLEAEVLVPMGTAYAQLGRNVEAEQVLHEALQSALASHHDDLLAEISAQLIWSVGLQSRFQEAELWSRFADATIERETMSNPIKYSWVLNDMGAVYYLQQRFGQALEYQERARQIKEKTLGPDDPDVAVTLANIALVLNKLGRSAEALRMSDRRLRIHQRALGDSHPAMGDELSNRGEILLALDRPLEAIDAYQRAKKIWEREFGDDVPAVAYALTGIGRALVILKKPKEALPDLERALSIRERSDPEPSRLAETELWLASAIWDGNRDFDRSVGLARKALEQCGQSTALEPLRIEISKWLATHRASMAGAGPRLRERSKTTTL